jgi:hypothetical protein
MKMKLQNRNLLLCLLGVVLVVGCKPQNGSPAASVTGEESGRSKEQLVAKYFPKKMLPLEVNPIDPVSPANIMTGIDKEKLFPDATDGDIHALASIELFPGYTTIIYREDWLYSDTYIVTYRDGQFSISNGQVIADIFTDGEGSEGYNIASIEPGGRITTKGAIDGMPQETTGVFLYEADNSLVEEN